MLNQNDPTAISRRNALKAGLAGIAALGTGLLGPSCAFAEEAADGSQTASQDLTALSNDELLALEAAVRAEKVRRQINTAVVPQGQYVAGVDFAAGTYMVTAIADGDDWGGDVTIYDTQTKDNQLSWDLLHEGDSLKVTLAEGNLLKLDDGSFALSPFTIDFGMATDTSTPEESAAEIQASSADSSAEQVTPEFKEMMDGYEAFMNSYCDFMVKYNDVSDSGDTASLSAMMGDYTSLVQQELDWLDKINAVDQSTLSTADAAYYVAVQGRVSQKLLETGVSAG